MLTKLATCAGITLLMASSAQSAILPPNNLHLQDTVLAANMTEEEFNEIITQAEEIYKPVIEGTHGARLRFNRLWTNSTVNASASQSFGAWTVNMYGGLARRPEVTPDGFALVVCHELGHHLAGFPFSSRWAANEGQSDYYATLTCARELWRDDIERNAEFRETIDEFPKALCDEVWEDIDDQNLCYRSMEGGKSLADLLSALRNQTVSFETPDTNTVSRTQNSHPQGQCRLDTYMAGALCKAEWDIDVIPGKDLGSRRNSAQAEEAAGEYSCLQQIAELEEGVRPLCWFKSQL
ncbi:MAG: hypothetical protein HRU19_05115 [Pseudobacteriovorax sp.]|nr:hypothetical protein [Pseudobacteriovorax sp.]